MIQFPIYNQTIRYNPNIPVVDVPDYWKRSLGQQDASIIFVTNNKYEPTYNKIKDDKNFQELTKTKFFKGSEGLSRLVSTMYELDLQKAQHPYPQQLPWVNINYYRPIPYEKYDTKDYLRLLNDFVKNEKLSEDLKEYFIKTKIDKLDIYYTRFDKLNDSDNPMQILTEKIPYSKE